MCSSDLFDVLKAKLKKTNTETRKTPAYQGGGNKLLLFFKSRMMMTCECLLDLATFTVIADLVKNSFSWIIEDKSDWNALKRD